MGLGAVVEQALWLGFSGLSDKENMDFLGASVTAIRKQCDLKKQEGEAFQNCLPHKSTASGEVCSAIFWNSSGHL